MKKKEGFSVSITARFKHGDLREAMLKRGWNGKQTASFLGMNYQSFIQLVNLRRIPKRLTMLQTEGLKELTGKTPEELWPAHLFTEEFVKKPKILETIREIPLALLETAEVLQLPKGPQEQMEELELRELVRQVLGTLPPRQAEVVKRHILEDEPQNEIALSMSVSRERIRQLLNEALKKLRHPVRSRKLKPFLPGDSFWREFL